MPMSTHLHHPVRGPSQGVSVVIPAYRSEGTICRAIDSVLAQTEPAAEIVVVDDGSPDGQASLVERTYGHRVTLVRKPNGGAASARNVGIDRAKGDYVAFLDADDYWEPDKLSQQLGIFDKHREVVLVAGAFHEETPGLPRHDRPRNSAARSWYDRVLRLGGLRAFRLATMIFTTAVIVRRGALGDLRFDSGFESGEDRDLWVRIVSRHPAYLLSKPVATAVLVEGSLSRSSVEKDCSNMLRVVDRHRALLGPLGYAVWRSHTLYRWAALDPDQAAALPRLLRSFALWPLPYTGLASCSPFGRVKKLAVLLAAVMRRNHDSTQGSAQR